MGNSKFGGHPDVPENFIWPQCDLGKLGFLGQINFNEVKNSLATYSNKLPKDGLILFFAFQDDDIGVQPGVVEKIGSEYKKIEGLILINLTNVEYFNLLAIIEEIFNDH